MRIRIITRMAAVIAVLVSFCLATSCQSKEEKVISQLESVCKAAEKGNLDAKDLESLQAKYETIHQSAKECDFTNEQLKEVASLDARYMKAVAKNAVERAGNAVEGFFEGLSGDKE